MKNQQDEVLCSQQPGTDVRPVANRCHGTIAEDLVEREACMMERPTATEYKPSYEKYFDLVPAGDYSGLLRRNSFDSAAFFEGIATQMHDHRYAEGKWTVKEVLLHIIDTERVFAYRALAAARGDKSPVYRMDEELYTRNADVARRTWASLVAELKAVRQSTELLFESVTDEQSKRACQIVTHPMTVRAIGYFIIGHMEHHRGIIRDRYLR